ncbi:unnamed protein product [Colias eurytheme]|nr:unnamed protein product [Colias eurytheme]
METSKSITKNKRKRPSKNSASKAYDNELPSTSAGSRRIDPHDFNSDEEQYIKRSLYSCKVAQMFNLPRITKQEFKGKPARLRKIGGPGKIVQIDESKFGKSKYNRGRHIEGHGELGLIEDGSKNFGERPYNPFIAPDGTYTQRIAAQCSRQKPGQTLRIGDALVRTGVPLAIKKGGANIEITDNEYTLNRLTGLCAAFAAQQGSGFVPKCAMAVSLGLDPARDKILYYSAAGAEHFPDIFTDHPLLCAIKQLENGKVTKENIASIAAVKPDDGKTLAAMLSDSKPSLESKLSKFGTGGSRGIVELEKALRVVRSLSVARFVLLRQC